MIWRFILTLLLTTAFIGHASFASANDKNDDDAIFVFASFGSGMDSNADGAEFSLTLGAGGELPNTNFGVFLLAEMNYTHAFQTSESRSDWLGGLRLRIEVLDRLFIFADAGLGITKMGELDGGEQRIQFFYAGGGEFALFEHLALGFRVKRRVLDGKQNSDYVLPPSSTVFSLTMSIRF